jgi:hypothetical protein
VLSQTNGLVIHVLRTRAPLSPPKGFSFDLHVLSPPQTFALSQDQTLQFDACLPDQLLSCQDFCFCHRAAPPSRESRSRDEVVDCCQSTVSRGRPSSTESLSTHSDSDPVAVPWSMFCSPVFRKRSSPSARCLGRLRDRWPLRQSGCPGQGTRFLLFIRGGVKLLEEVFRPGDAR